MSLPATASAASPATPITKAHKAAIILAALGAETAKAIVEGVSDAHLRAFARALGELKSVPPQLLHAVAREFLAEIDRSAMELPAGAAEARRVLEAITGPERAGRVLAGAAASGPDAVWARLAGVDAASVADYLARLRLPVAGLILSRLSFEATANILAAANPDFAGKALVELSRPSQASQAAIAAVAAGVEAELLKPSTARPEAAVAEAVTEIIGCLPSDRREAFVGYLSAADPEIGAAVRKSLLTFETLHLRLPEAAAPALIRDIDKDTLLAAIKLGRENAPEAVAFLFSAISKRMADQYEEELGAAELDRGAGEDAQRRVVATVRRLVAAGAFRLVPARDPPST